MDRSDLLDLLEKGIYEQHSEERETGNPFGPGQRKRDAAKAALGGLPRAGWSRPTMAGAFLVGDFSAAFARAEEAAYGVSSGISATQWFDRVTAGIGTPTNDDYRARLALAHEGSAPC